MANLPIQEVWAPDIYQYETADDLQGGPDGIDNIHGKQLGNRTAWLKKQIDNVIEAADLDPDASELDQLLKAITALIAEGGSEELVGVPIPWPSATVPDGYIAMIGQAFDKNALPKLALAYPGGTLPDMRGEFIRGWDNGRGVDLNRAILSLQLDAFEDHTHTYHSFRRTGRSEQLLTPEVNFTIIPLDTSGATGRTANETRPRNLAFNFMVRAA